MEEQPPIELNYAGEAPKKDDPSLDSRLLRVKLPKGYKAKRGTLSLKAAPGNTEGLPLRVRAGTEDYRETEVVFRAELDIQAIQKIWHTVDAAALPKEHKVLITVETEPPPKRAKQTAKCRTVATINLNSIRWKWWPLERDENGAVVAGKPEENTPVRIEIDGTDLHGFKLEVWREKKGPKGYERQESDFTHYLAPEEPRVSFKIVKPKPVPSDIEAGKDQSEIETIWWAQKLDEGEAILKDLPIDTTIRVRAWPASSIRKHRLNDRPLTTPDDAPQLAVREIPLKLECKKYKTRVLTPNPDEPPVELSDPRPWEDCINAEIQLFDDSGGKERYCDEEVEWKLLPGKDGKFSGTVSYEGNKGLHNGTWKMRESGKVAFRFVPEKHNALFLQKKDGVQHYAQFEVRLKDPATGALSPVIPPADKSAGKGAPTFVLDWAPKFDLGLFKLPFFTKTDAPMNLEPEQKDEDVKPLVLKLDEKQSISYRNVFRHGGTIQLGPIVPWELEEGGKLEIPMQHYRLVVGDGSRKPDEKAQIHKVEASKQAAWPETATFPARPGAAARTETADLKCKAPLHPEMVERFHSLRKQAASLDPALRTPAAGGWEDGRYRKLVAKFEEEALRYFCEAEFDTLRKDGKGIRVTLGAMSSFLDSERAAWELLPDAISLHRDVYKRYEDTLVNGYFDILGFKYFKEKLKVLSDALGSTRAGRFLLDFLFPDRIISAGFEKAQTAVLKSRLAVWIGNRLQEAIAKNNDEVGKAAAALTEPTTARTEAVATFERAISQCEQHASSLAGDAASFASSARATASRLRELRAQGVTGDALRESMRTQLTELQESWKKFMQARDKFRASVPAAVGHYKAAAVAEAKVSAAQLNVDLQNHTSRTLAGLNSDYEKLLTQTELKPDAAEKFMSDVAARPDSTAECVNLKSTAADKTATAISGHQQSLERLVKDHYEMMGNLKADVEANLNREIALPASDTDVITQGFARLRDTQIAAAVQDSQNEMTRLTEEAADFLGKARQLANLKIDISYKRWFSTWKSLEEKLEDKMNDPNTSLESQMNVMLNDNVPQPPSETDIVGAAFDMALSAINGFKSFVMSVMSWLVKAVAKVGWAVFWVIGVLLRVLLATLVLLLTFVRSMLGKWAEMIASVFEWLREFGGGKFSCLSAAAFQKADEVTRGAGGADLFAFPYLKEVDLARQVKHMGEEFSKEPEWADKAKQAVRGLFRTGYDDYYPGQIQATRLCFYELAKTVFTRKTLETPPIDDLDEAGHLAFLQAETCGNIKRQIAGYARKIANAANDQNAFYGGYWAELKDTRGFNSISLDITLSMAGWGGAWLFRIAGCILAIAGIVGVVVTEGLGIPLYLGTVTGCFAAAEVADLITATSRLMCALLGYYPYASAYPRDVALLPGIYHAMIFKPKGSKLAAASTADLMGKSHIDFGY